MTDLVAKPPFRKVYVVYKKTVYQKYVLEGKNKKLIKLLSLNDPIVTPILKSHETHTQSLQIVQDLLKSHKIKYTLTPRTHIKSLKSYDLIITVGGDGTFLRTCHHVKDHLVLGLNSVPKQSVGALCAMNVSEFKKNFERILAGDYKIHERQRIQFKINNQIIPIEPINDILFTNISPAAMSRYDIHLGRKREEHRSSGIWIATPAGSTAAIQAAGGKIEKCTANRLQYLIREPYQGKFNPYKLTHGFIKPGESLKITSKMDKSRLFWDGPTQYYSLEYGDQVSLTLSQHRLKTLQI